MNNATVLADALVEAGIGRKAVHGGMPHYSTDTVSPLDSVVWVRADEFITDWRVAGKALESITEDQFTWFKTVAGNWCVTELDFEGREWVSDSLPRAIIEAWYEARQ